MTPIRRFELFNEKRVWQEYKRFYTETAVPGFRTPLFFSPRFDTLYLTSSAAVQFFLANNPILASNSSFSASNSSAPHALIQAYPLRNMNVRTLVVRFILELSTTKGILPVVDMLKVFATVETLIVTVRERQGLRAASSKNRIVERMREAGAWDKRVTKEGGVHVRNAWRMPVVRFMTGAEFGARRGI